MGIEIINPKEVAFTNKKRTVLMSTRKLHSWLIYYEPGRRDEMHCHNGDQTFHMIAGECTMSATRRTGGNSRHRHRSFGR